jgi:predicted DNA-binding protein (MmcQ/YjbR family)
MTEESEVVQKIRALCMALPETEERPFGGHTAPTFRVRDKMFVNTSEDGSSMILKGAPGAQEALIASSPETYFVPAYVGHRGWIGVRLDVALDWEEMTELIEDSYRLIAPRRLQALLPDPK